MTGATCPQQDPLGVRDTILSSQSTCMSHPSRELHPCYLKIRIASQGWRQPYREMDNFPVCPVQCFPHKWTGFSSPYPWDTTEAGVDCQRHCQEELKTERTMYLNNPSCNLVLLFKPQEHIFLNLKVYLFLFSKEIKMFLCSSKCTMSPRHCAYQAPGQKGQERESFLFCLGWVNGSNYQPQWPGNTQIF